MLDAQNSTALQSSVLDLEYVGYWSHAKDAPLYRFTEQVKSLSVSSLLKNYTKEICKYITNCET
jgi:hypothetical protein